MYGNTFLVHDFIYIALDHKVIIYETIPVTVYNSDAFSQHGTYVHILAAATDLLNGTSYVKYRSYIRYWGTGGGAVG